jgi:hypothetical protein
MGCKILGNRPSIWGLELLTAKVADTMRGKHADDMDIIIEEAQGCNEDMLTILRGTQTNPNGLFFMIGNPASSSGMFFDAFHAEQQYYKLFTWNSEKLTRMRWFDPQRNKDYERKYGRDSDFYRVNVLGEFPVMSDNTVISRAKLMAVIKNANEEDFLTSLGEHSYFIGYGLDFARKGGDESVMAKREAKAITRIKVIEGMEPVEIYKEVQKDVLLNDLSKKDYIITLDGSGMGQAMISHPLEAGENFHVFHNHGRPMNASMFYDKITEAYFYVRECVEKGDFYMFYDEIAIRQLTNRLYEFKGGKFKLEEKDKYKLRMGESPDRADAVVMAYYTGTEEKMMVDGV